MTEASQENRSLFMAWLSSKIAASELKELSSNYDEIEKECIKSGIIRGSLFESFSEELVKEVKQAYDKKKLFWLFHRRQAETIMLALSYLLDYINEQNEPTATEIFVSCPESGPIDAETSVEMENLAPEGDPVESIETVMPSSEPMSLEEPASPPEVRLSDELQCFLQDERYALLREKLSEKGILTISEFKSTQLWVFMNRHNLYSVGERQSIYSEMISRLHPKEADKDGSADAVTEIIPEQTFEVVESNQNDDEAEENLLPVIPDETIKTDDGDSLISDNKPEVTTVLITSVESGFEPIELPDVEYSVSSEVPKINELTKEKSYSELYSLEPNSYKGMLIQDCGFSVRVLGRLLKNGIENVGGLLAKSDTDLLAISGFGANSLNEIHGFLRTLREKGPVISSMSLKPRSICCHILP